jgi:hypothetical protein
MSNGNGRAQITVRGPNVVAPPLLVTEDAHVIEFRDGFGELNALLVRMPGGDELWGLVTKNDEDWAASLVRYGYITADKTAEDIIRKGL